MRRLVFVAVLAVAVLSPAAIHADGDSEEDESFALRVNGDYRVAAGESIDTLIVVRGNAIVEGAVDDALFVVDGDAVVSGVVEGDLTVISGKLTLRPGATAHNVTLFRSELVEEAGSRVTGTISQRENFPFTGAAFLFGALAWVASTIAVVLAGLVFAGVGGRQLNATAGHLTGRPGRSALAALVVWIGIPLASVLAMITLVGIPAGLGTLLFVLPTLGFLGYVAAGTALGRLILRRNRRDAPVQHPYAEASLGLLILQVVVLVPGLGALMAVLATLGGAGALGYTAWCALRGSQGLAPVPPPSAPATGAGG